MVIKKLKLESKKQIFISLKNSAQDQHFKIVLVWIKKIAFLKNYSLFWKILRGSGTVFRVEDITVNKTDIALSSRGFYSNWQKEITKKN